MIFFYCLYLKGDKSEGRRERTDNRGEKKDKEHKERKRLKDNSESRFFENPTQSVASNIKNAIQKESEFPETAH